MPENLHRHNAVFSYAQGSREAGWSTSLMAYDACWTATDQVPQSVIDRTSKYLAEEHSNIHRGVHYLSQHATTAYEAAREKVKRFINAPDVNCCIFVRGTTEGINLVASSYGKKFISEGDEIIISGMEHTIQCLFSFFTHFS